MKMPLSLMPWPSAVLLALVLTSHVFSHGTPIQIGVADNELLTSGGTSDDQGFASQIFLQDGEDGDPFGAVTLPGLGPVIIWQLPGLDISGMDDQSSLSIEAIRRPVKDTDPVEDRLLWYWDPTSELVEAAPASAAIYLLGTGMRSAALTPPDGIAPPPFTLADSVAGQQGFHNHGLLSYALDNSPVAPVGAYGFFARFLSNQYTVSEPFLLIFNYGVDYEQMLTAALEINAAAASGDLPGDYNRDHIVDAADYTVWRDNGWGPEKYAQWKSHFGHSNAEKSNGSGASVESAAVPEPAAPIILVLSTFAFSRIPRHLHRSPNRVRFSPQKQASN